MVDDTRSYGAPRRFVKRKGAGNQIGSDPCPDHGTAIPKKSRGNRRLRVIRLLQKRPTEAKEGSRHANGRKSSRIRPKDSPKHDLNVRLFVALMAHAVVVNAVVSLARITTSYRAIELDLSVFWIGLIAGGFSLVPVFAAVWAGRFIDRGHDAVSAWGGAFLMLLPAPGCGCGRPRPLNCWPSRSCWASAKAHVLRMASHQMISVRCAGPISRNPCSAIA